MDPLIIFFLFGLQGGDNPRPLTPPSPPTQDPCPFVILTERFFYYLKQDGSNKD